MSYNRLTDKDLIKNININQNQDLTSMIAMVKRLWELENAIENGEYAKLPCKVGDTMWLLNDPYFVADICEVVIEDIKISRNGTTIFCVYNDEYCEFVADAVFKTKAEAEMELKRLRNIP